MPGTRWIPSSTIDHPSRSERSIAASTPTRTFRVWSRKPRRRASPASSSSAFVSARPGLEARVVHRRHERRREERAHRLADEVGRGDARDAEPVRGLGRDRRLAGPGRAADEQDDRRVELLDRVQAAKPPDRSPALLLAEHVRGELGEPVELDAIGAARRQIGVGASGEIVRAGHAEARGGERPRHETLRPRWPVVAAERQRREVATLAHRTTSANRHGRLGREALQLGVERRLAGKRHDVVRRDDDLHPAAARLLDDDVDRRRLQLDEEDVRVDRLELLPQARPVGEAARDVGRSGAVDVCEVPREPLVLCSPAPSRRMRRARRRPARAAGA